MAKEEDARRSSLSAAQCREEIVRLQALVDHTTDAIFCFELAEPVSPDLALQEQIRRLHNGTLINCNDSFAAGFGMQKAHEALGKTFTQIFGVKDGSMDPFFAAFVEHGYNVVNQEQVEVMEDGEKHYYLTNTRGEMQGAEVVRVWGSSSDITHHKLAQQALQRSEERYRSLVEDTLDGYFSCEVPSGRMIYINDKARALFGYAPGDDVPSIQHFVAEEENEHLRRRLEGRTRGEIPSSSRQTYTGQRKDGSTFRFEVSTATLVNGDKTLLQGVLRDITEYEVLQKRLLHAQKMESIGTLAGGIAHDFNNLLMGIQGTASILLHRLDPADALHPMLESINLYAQKGAKLTAQLLGLARAGQYEQKPIDVQALIETSSQFFGRTHKEITIQTYFAPSLPFVKGDQGQIEQVLLNLYLNAWQAMPVGGTLRLQAEDAHLSAEEASLLELAEGHYLEISVEDTGQGMDSETRQRVFDPFFTTKETGSGTGLGLASAYGIVTNHGGMITVESTPGEGTTFTIFLPAEEGRPQASPQKQDEALLRGKATILVVDDEEVTIRTCARMLTHLGHSVLVANSGREALDLLSAKVDEIDLVLLDMIMPEMSGGATFDKIKTQAPELKVLLCSGYSASGEALAILDRGCNGFLQKPFSLETLASKVHEVLEEEG